jgi:hypothetical protein
MQGPADVAEQVEQREEVFALPLEGLDAALKAGNLVGRSGGECRQGS